MKNRTVLLFFCFVCFVACSPNSKSNLNLEASINESGDLTENPLLEKVINTIINPTAETMQTLYGNSIAWDYVNTHADLNYPKGSILYLVTWKQKPDTHWFGANIPKEILSVEQVSFLEERQPNYQLFQGVPMRKVTSNDTSKLAFILKQKMAVSP